MTEPTREPERRFRLGKRHPAEREALVEADERSGGADGTVPENTRPDLGPPAPGVQPVEQPGSGLGIIVSVAVTAVVFILAIYATGQPTPNRIPLLQTTNPLFWIVAALAVLAAGAGSEYAERTASRQLATYGRGRPEGAPATSWIVPSIATLAAIMLVATYHNAVMLVVGPLIAFFGSFGALLARDLIDDASDNALRSAATIHTVVVLAIAFLAFSAVYLNKMSTPVTSVLVGLIGGLLMLETFERSEAPTGQRVLYSLIVGIVLAQAAAALMWWPTHGWTGGAVLLVCFYLASGIVLSFVRHGWVRTRDMLEFGAVSLVALIFLAVTA